ncbi:hypothetical protein [Streptomyces sp. HSG2]|uniref:hypothetical protein n=1 Tax=Streptomyces sp. HSG2 TaxID=2797167 RepID=UPI001906A9DE|nr:hypothetical protein [Streptomyces sp. HSG2]
MRTEMGAEMERIEEKVGDLTEYLGELREECEGRAADEPFVALLGATVTGGIAVVTLTVAFSMVVAEG